MRLRFTNFQKEKGRKFYIDDPQRMIYLYIYLPMYRIYKRNVKNHFKH